jgi:uncharacterized protein YjcR
MPEPRAPDVKEQAKKDYLKGMKYTELAEKYGVTINTIKSWKQRYKWDRKGVHTKDKKGAHKRGAPKGNKNALGNTGGAPPGNKNAETHGFFSKYLPEETLEIMHEIETRNPLDLLWDQIVIQYTAIIRAQRIMYVTGKDEMLKELKKQKSEKSIAGPKDNKQAIETYSETEWEFQFAWDRQATFLKAQSRAMAELRNMIKQYDELLKSNLATEEQELRINKLKAEIKNLKGEGTGNDQEGINNFIKATTMKEDEIKAMFEGDNDEAIQEES